MSRFLMIENKVSSIPSFELLRTLGASSSRGIESRRGQFGTGTIYALAVLARAGLLDKTKFCMGNDVYKFFLENVEVMDSGGRLTYLSKLWGRQQNGGRFEFNVDSNFGIAQWRYDVGMAIRELITNAIDGADSYDGTSNSVNVELVENDRAKKDFIRVYVPATDEVIDYYENIRDHFICLNPNYKPNRRIIENHTNKGATFYRKGVDLGTFGERSIFHYNFPDIEVNESRLIDSTDAREAAAKAIARADADKLILFLKGITDSKVDYFEKSLDSWYLNPENLYLKPDELEAAKANWATAWRYAFGAQTVMVDSNFARDAAESRGYQVAQLPDSVTPALRVAGVATADKVLTKDELSGRVAEPAPGWLMQTFDDLWVRANEFQMTRNREYPIIKIFVVDDTNNDYYKDVIIDRDDHTISINNKYIQDEDATREIVTQALGFYCTKASYLESGAVARWVAKLALQLMRRPLTIDAAHTNELPAPEPVDLEPTPYDYV